MNNPFADLIPAQPQQNPAVVAQGGNPFADLIPQENDAAVRQQYLPSNNTRKILNAATTVGKFVPGVDAASSVLNMLTPSTSAGENLFGGASRGMLDVGQGVKQKAILAAQTLGILPQGSADNYTKQTDAQLAQYANSSLGQSTAADVGRFSGQTLPLMIIPGGMAGGMVMRGLTGGAAGAGMGAAQYVPEGGSGTFNTALGGILGAGAAALLPPVFGAGIKTYNAIKGGTEDAAQKAVIAAGEKAGVPVYAADVSNNPAVQGASQALEDVPFLGMRAARKGQMEAAQNAAENVRGDLSQQMLETPYGGLTGQRAIEKAAAGNTPRAKGAQALLEDMKNSGDDWNRIAQTSQNTQLFRGKLIADKKYDHVSQLADRFGAVDTSATLSTVNRMIANEENSVLKNKDLLNTLNEVKNGLFEKQSAQTSGKILDEFGAPFIQAESASVVPRQLNYSQVRDLRSDLSYRISDYFSGSNAAIGKKGVGALQALKDSITSDMDAFAKTNGSQLKTAWQNADQFYQKAVAPAKDRLLAQSLKNADPDTIYSKWIMQGDKKDRATRFYNSLDDKGKAAIRYGMVNDAYTKAAKEDGLFSPGRFASELEKVRGARGAIFQGSDKSEMDGFVKLMRQVDRSYQAVNKPDTGVKTIPYLIAGGLGYGVHAAGVATGTTAIAGTVLGGARFLLGTQAGRKLLTASSQLRVGSSALQSLLDTSNKLIQRSMVGNSVRTMGAPSKNTQSQQSLIAAPIPAPRQQTVIPQNMMNSQSTPLEDLVDDPSYPGNE